MSYEARVPNVTTEGQSSTIKRCSLTAFRFCQNQKSQQPAKVLLQQQLPAGGVSVQAWQSWLLGSGVSADLCSVENKWLCARPRLLNEGNPCLPFPRQTVRNLWNRDPINWGFEPTASCRFCIHETQFYTASLQKHCKSCKKSGPRNQPSSADTVKPVKERSSPCGILRGKSSTQGNHCQC